MKYCTKCGKELFDEAMLCPNCGCMQNTAGGIGMNFQNVVPDEQLLQNLSRKVKTNGIIWLCIGILQCLSLVFIIVGILNIIEAVNDMKYSDDVLKKPVGIVKHFEPMKGAIITLVYNLIFGGIIGVAGSLYYILGIRDFVLNNRAAFDAIEQKYTLGAAK